MLISVSRRKLLHILAVAGLFGPYASSRADEVDLSGQLGFNLVAWGVAPWSLDALNNALESVSSFGAKRVTLVTFRYVDPLSGEITHESGSDLPDAPSDELIKQVLIRGHALGLQMSLNPLVEMAHPKGIGHLWRGDMQLDGAARSTFFTAYRAYLLDMSALANDIMIHRLYIGSELMQLSIDPTLTADWLDLITSLRANSTSGSQVADGVYSLRLSYSANFSEYRDVTFWHALDEIAVSAYFPLATRKQALGPGAPSSDTIFLNWSRHLEALKQFGTKVGKPIAVSEWGLTPWDAATTVPWDVAPSSEPDPQEQLHAYAAILHSLSTNGRWLSEFNIWHWYVEPESGPFAIEPGSKLAELISTKAFGK